MESVPIRGKNAQGMSFVVDDEDFENVSSIPWRLSKYGYVYHRKYIGSAGQNKWRYKWVTLHNYILGQPIKGMIDHIDGDKLNNSRANLRISTRQQNTWNSKKSKTNTSGYVGVVWCATTNRWRATIYQDGQHIDLGRFDTPQEAGFVYDQFALQLRGEYARLNML